MIIALLFLCLVLTALLAADGGWNNVLSAARNDLVFAGRNQDYGAYKLRREHPRTMLLSLLLGLGLVGAVATLPMAWRSEPAVLVKPQVVIDDVIFDPVTADPVAPKPPDPLPPQPQPSGPSLGSGVLTAVDSVPAIPVDTVTAVVIPDPGPGAGGGTRPDPGPVGGGGTDGGSDGGSAVKNGWEVDVMPEYPGGEPALHRYLSRSIIYPNDAIHEREEGRVVVGFVVTSDGSVAETTILKGVSPTIDAEAIRVVRKMVKWKPGRFRDREVNVRYQLPIMFKLER